MRQIHKEANAYLLVMRRDCLLTHTLLAHAFLMSCTIELTLRFLTAPSVFKTVYEATKPIFLVAPDRYSSKTHVIRVTVPRILKSRRPWHLRINSTRLSSHCSIIVPQTLHELQCTALWHEANMFAMQVHSDSIACSSVAPARSPTTSACQKQVT